MLVISKRPGGSMLIIGERDLEGLGAGSQPGGLRCDPFGMATCKAVMDHSLEGKWRSAILTLQNYMYAGIRLMLILLK